MAARGGGRSVGKCTDMAGITPTPLYCAGRTLITIFPLVQSIEKRLKTNCRSTSKRQRVSMRLPPNRSMSEVSVCEKRKESNVGQECGAEPLCPSLECIVFTWDYHTSQSIWNSLRVQPILSDEVQTFKALILVNKVLQEGHPIVSVLSADGPGERFPSLMRFPLGFARSTSSNGMV
jgi:hypothetical protein